MLSFRSAVTILRADIQSLMAVQMFIALKVFFLSPLCRTLEEANLVGDVSAPVANHEGKA